MIAEAEEKLDRVDEVETVDDHDEIDGVIVLPTAKAASEVRSALCRGVELPTTWAEESDVAFRDLYGDFEDLKNRGDREVVPEKSQQVVGDSLSHGCN